MEVSFTSLPNALHQHALVESVQTTNAGAAEARYRFFALNCYGQAIFNCTVESFDELSSGISYSSTEHKIMLKECLDLPEAERTSKSLEVACFDATTEGRDQCTMLVAVCWVRLDPYGYPTKTILSLMRLELREATATLLHMEELEKPVAMCRFIVYEERPRRGILYCQTDLPPVLREITVSPTGEYGLLAECDLKTEMAELLSEPIKGTAVRFCSKHIGGKYRFTMLSTDKGYFYFWRTVLESGVVELVKRLRFYGVTSLLDVFTAPCGETGDDLRPVDAVYAMVGSTIGPVNFYRVVEEVDVNSPNSPRLSWQLVDRIVNDAAWDVMTCFERQGNVLVIGTFSSNLVFYDMNQLGKVEKRKSQRMRRASRRSGSDDAPSNDWIPLLTSHFLVSPIQQLKFVSKHQLSITTQAGHHHINILELLVDVLPELVERSVNDNLQFF